MKPEYKLSLKDKILIAIHDLKHLPSNIMEKLEWQIAYMLPEKVAYFATIRVGAHATTGIHSSTCVPDMTFIEALKRWDASD